MKVCTDACLFGAWTAANNAIKQAQSILDIGTGTGLISLMLAQATSSNSLNTKITAIEIEQGAAAEAGSNFIKSPWASNLQLVQSSIQDFSHTMNPAVKLDTEKTTTAFDCIISNPPFFEGDLQSPDAHKNLALHSVALPWTDLIKAVNILLKPEGHYFVLLPALRAYTMQKLAAENGMQLEEEVVVFNAAKQKPFRVFQHFINTSTPINEIKRSNFIIKDAENKYTESFVQLLSPYYLHL